MGALYFLGAATVAGVFVWEIIHRREIRTGLLFITLVTGAAAVGLWRVKPWGRGLGLFVVFANSGLGAVALLSAVVSNRGGKLVPAILLVASMVVGFALGTSIFSLPDDR